MQTQHALRLYCSLLPGLRVWVMAKAAAMAADSTAFTTTGKCEIVDGEIVRTACGVNQDDDANGIDLEGNIMPD